MLITSTKLSTPKPAAREPDPAGVILAVPEMKFDDGGTVQTIAEGMYVFPADADASNPFATELSLIAKRLSISFASQLHPHLGTAARAGWVIAGACSLLNRRQQQKLSWKEIAIDGGLLTVETLLAASSALPDAVSIDTDWSEGTSCLIEATKYVADGGDANHFVMGQMLDQSPPVGHLRTLLSLTLAAQHPNSMYAGISSNSIDVTVKPTRNGMPGFLSPESENAKRKSA